MKHGDDHICIREFILSKLHYFTLAGAFHQEPLMCQLLQSVANWHTTCTKSFTEIGLH
jgi:hypothetical protein